MDIVNFSRNSVQKLNKEDYDRYYYIMYRILYKAKVDERDMQILHHDTKVLLDDNDKFAGFYTGEIISDMYNLHHFFIDEEYRKYKVICDFILDFNNRAKELGCKFILLHIRSNSGEKRFFNKFYSESIVSQFDSPFDDIEMYKVEVL